MLSIDKIFSIKLSKENYTKLQKVVNQFKDDLWINDFLKGYKTHIMNTTQEKAEDPIEFVKRFRVPDVNPKIDIQSEETCESCKIPQNSEKRHFKQKKKKWD